MLRIAQLYNEVAEQARVNKPKEEQADEYKALLYEEVSINGPTMDLHGYSTAPYNPIEMKTPELSNPVPEETKSPVGSEVRDEPAQFSPGQAMSMPYMSTMEITCLSPRRGRADLTMHHTGLPCIQYLLTICLTIALIGMKLLAKKVPANTKHKTAKQVDYCTASKDLDRMAVVQADVALLPTSPQPVPMKATKSGTGEENASSSTDLLPAPSSYKNIKMISPLVMVIFTHEKEEKETDITKFLPYIHTHDIISYHPTKTTAPSAIASPRLTTACP